MNPLVAEWLAKADEDEDVVALIRANGGPWPLAAYHAQQAAEKRLKAVLVDRGAVPPYTHDLVALANLVPGVAPDPATLLAAQNLTVFATTTRYPAGPVLTGADTLAAVADLQTITTWVNALL